MLAERRWTRFLVFFLLFTVLNTLASSASTAWNIAIVQTDVIADATTANGPPVGLSDENWAQMLSLIEHDSYEISASSGSRGKYFQSINTRHKMRTLFQADRVQVTPSEHAGDWEWSVSLRAYGYAGSMQAVGQADLVVEGNRIEYRRGNLSEWYINDRRGLEQGFTFEERPAQDGKGGLVLELAFEGNLLPDWLTEGQSVKFENVAGEPVLAYGGLLAWDSAGTLLPSEITRLPEGWGLWVNDREATYPITIDPVVTNEDAKLLASDAAAGDELGLSVAASGNTVVVGAFLKDEAGPDSGAAYVFEKPTGGWASPVPLTETTKLIASDGAPGDRFGLSVAVSGDTVVVGAWADDDAGPQSGSAYVFEKPSGGWASPVPLTEARKLLASDGAPDDRFGRTMVAIHGETVIVGAYLDDDSGSGSGSAYVFEKPSGGWASPVPLTETTKLLASDGAPNDEFGIWVTISGNTAVVGAWRDDDNGSDSGSAYVFEKPSGGWASPVPLTETTKLIASDGAPGDRFGNSMFLSGNTLAVGAFLHDSSAVDSGSAYVFEEPAGGWASAMLFTQTSKLISSDAVSHDQLGNWVASSGNTIVVGAFASGTGRSGSAYVFEKPAAGWASTPQLTESTKLISSDAASSDKFGGSVGVSGGTIVVGANWNDDAGSASGSAYIFARDNEGPTTSNVASTPNPASVTDTITVSASIDDSTTGGGIYRLS